MEKKVLSEARELFKSFSWRVTDTPDDCMINLDAKFSDGELSGSFFFDDTFKEASLILSYAYINEDEEIDLASSIINELNQFIAIGNLYCTSYGELGFKVVNAICEEANINYVLKTMCMYAVDNIQKSRDIIMDVIASKISVSEGAEEFLKTSQLCAKKQNVDSILCDLCNCLEYMGYDYSCDDEESTVTIIIDGEKMMSTVLKLSVKSEYKAVMAVSVLMASKNSQMVRAIAYANSRKDTGSFELYDKQYLFFRASHLYSNDKITFDEIYAFIDNIALKCDRFYEWFLSLNLDKITLEEFNETIY